MGVHPVCTKGQGHGGEGSGVRPGEKGLRFDLRGGGPATRACLVVLYRGGGDFGTRSAGTSLRRGSGTSRLRGSYCLGTHVGQYPGWGKGPALGYSWGCPSVCVCPRLDRPGDLSRASGLPTAHCGCGVRVLEFATWEGVASVLRTRTVGLARVGERYW